MKWSGEACVSSENLGCWAASQEQLEEGTEVCLNVITLFPAFPLCAQKQQQEALVPTEEASSCSPSPLITHLCQGQGGGRLSLEHSPLACYWIQGPQAGLTTRTQCTPVHIEYL